MRHKVCMVSWPGTGGTGVHTRGAALRSYHQRLKMSSFGSFLPMYSRSRPHLLHEFDMDLGKASLAAECWAGKPLLGPESLTEANGALAAVLEVITRNSYRPEHGEVREASELHSQFRVGGILSNLARTQSQKQVTAITARLSVAAFRIQLPRAFWSLLSVLAPGILCTYSWTEDLFCEDCPPATPSLPISSFASSWSGRARQPVVWWSGTCLLHDSHRMLRCFLRCRRRVICCHVSKFHHKVVCPLTIYNSVTNRHATLQAQRTIRHPWR